MKKRHLVCRIWHFNIHTNLAPNVNLWKLVASQVFLIVQ